MALVFFCQSCGSRFEVDSRFAGKRGHCKHCGQMMTIPKAEALASMMAMPALAMAAAVAAPVGAPPRPTAAGAANEKDSLGWLKQAASNVGLAPLTLQGLSMRKKVSNAAQAAAAEFENQNSQPYVMNKPTFAEKKASRGTGVNKLAVLWRSQMGTIEKIFRWVNQSAYFVSIPFIMILLFGAVTKSHSTALFGATFVVLLNTGRLVSGIGNLLIVPIRDGPNTSSKRLKKPLWRVIEPVVTIALVLTVFTFVPGLSSGSKGGTITQRLESEARSLEKEMTGEVKQTVEKAKHLDVNSLEKQAESGLKSLSKQASESLKPEPVAPSKPQAKNPEASIEKVLEGVSKQAKEVIDASKGQP